MKKGKSLFLYLWRKGIWGQGRNKKHWKREKLMQTSIVAHRYMKLFLLTHICRGAKWNHIKRWVWVSFPYQYMQFVAKLSAASDKNLFSIIGMFTLTKFGLHSLKMQIGSTKYFFLHMKNNWETCRSRITSTKICSWFCSLYFVLGSNNKPESTILLKRHCTQKWTF